MITAPLRKGLQSRHSKVRSRIKTLLSTHPHPAPARLTVGGLYFPTGLMRADQRAAVCPGGGVGGLSIY